jgi:hypothetical protein
MPTSRLETTHGSGTGKFSESSFALQKLYIKTFIVSTVLNSFADPDPVGSGPFWWDPDPVKNRPDPHNW